MAKSSFNENWVGDINGKEYSHSRVFKISGDQFYALLSGQDDAFAQMYQALPKAIDDLLKTTESVKETAENSPFAEIKNAAVKNNLSILDQIAFDNYDYYPGFDTL